MIKDGVTQLVDIDEYNSEKLKHTSSGFVSVIDGNGNICRVMKDDIRYLNGELKHNMVGMVNVIDKHGYKHHVSNEYVRLIRCGKVFAVDSNNRRYNVNINDERIKNGILIPKNKPKKGKIK